MNTNGKDLYSNYLNEGFKPLRCAGYNPEFNREKDTGKKYRRAKEAIDKGFTKDNYKGLTISEIESWEKTGGWIGWAIPKGFIAIDVEDTASIRFIEDLCKQKNITLSVHITNNGKHFFFGINIGIDEMILILIPMVGTIDELQRRGSFLPFAQECASL
jgi:hypothetical protein